MVSLTMRQGDGAIAAEGTLIASFRRLTSLVFFFFPFFIPRRLPPLNLALNLSNLLDLF